MTPQEAKQHLKRIWKDYTSAYDIISEDDVTAFDMAINSVGAINQYRWERDIAIQQLKDLGYEFGEKIREDDLKSAQPEPCEDAVSRQRLLTDLKELIAAWKKYPVMAEQIKGVETAIGYVESIPSVKPDSKELSSTHKALDTISRQAAIRAISIYNRVVDKSVIKRILIQLPSVQPEWNNHTVACLLAELFSDNCACNFNGIDEWLPEKCEVIDACPNPVGVACWEQYLKHRAERGTDEQSD